MAYNLTVDGNGWAVTVTKKGEKSPFVKHFNSKEEAQAWVQGVVSGELEPVDFSAVPKAPKPSKKPKLRAVK